MNDDDRRLVRLHTAHLKRAGARPETVRQRAAHLARLAETVQVPLAEVTAEQLDAWQAAHARRLRPSSVRAYTSHVRTFYGWAQHAGHIDPNPAADLVVPKVPAGRPRPIAEDKLRIAIACAPEPIKTWLVLSAYLGLRAGEIARLTRDDIGDGVLDVDGKGGKPRTVPLPDDVLAMLAPHVHGPGPIWRLISGRPMTPDRVSALCCAHLREVGAGSTLHAGRHRYATRMYDVSRDLRLVQDVLGHASPATTAVYVAASAKAGRAAADQLARALRAS